MRCSLQCAEKDKEPHCVLCVKPCVLCDTFYVLISVCIAKAAKNRNGRKECRITKMFLFSTSPGIFFGTQSAQSKIHKMHKGE